LIEQGFGGNTAEGFEKMTERGSGGKMALSRAKAGSQHVLLVTFEVQGLVPF
jgi:hypothetical protein